MSDEVLSGYVANHIDRQIKRWLEENPGRDPREVVEEMLNNQPAEYRREETDKLVRDGLEQIIDRELEERWNKLSGEERRRYGSRYNLDSGME